MVPITKIVVSLCAASLASAAFGQSTPPPKRLDVLDPSRAARQDSVSRDPDARFSPSRDTVKSMRTYQHLLNYGDCVSRLGNSAQKILGLKPNSKPERRETVVLRERAETCQMGAIENIQSLVRGSIAEAMYRRTYKQSPSLAYDAARAQNFVKANHPFNSDREAADQTVIDATNCMVAANPAIAFSVLSAAHGSNEEAAAMDQLFSKAPECAGGQRPADLSRSFLRAFVADSAWQFATWSTAPAASGGTH